MLLGIVICFFLQATYMDDFMKSINKIITDYKLLNPLLIANEK